MNDKMNDNPLFSDECQLMGYGESDSGGAWIKYQVTPEDLNHFRGRKGELHHITILTSDQVESIVTDNQIVKKPNRYEGI